ncbi:tRNA pseudouridine synthase A [Xylanibacillus composti]|uniref:tRNA pseudouridine synthase A n=1 Tax=Xylanibacillus composti TaxID=1572762 RepID=A0A8J4H9A5_9BACL|nr:tRNA pseudouridine synthase A [Xylanibacillus composti]
MVSYAGTHFEGFQKQPRGRTVQGELESAIEKVTGQPTEVHGSGRTDSGVHAHGQVFSFYSDASIPPERWPAVLHRWLPQDIVVLKSAEAPSAFHPRYAAIGKTYRYSIWNSRVSHLFSRAFVYHHPVQLDVSRMNDALSHLIGRHDFTSFCSVRTASTKSRIRTLRQAEVVEEPVPYPPSTGRLLHLYVSGSGFLYNMVRIIAGTLIQVGEGKRNPEQMRSILADRNRQAAGPTARAEGLTLLSVDYGELDPFK